MKIHTVAIRIVAEYSLKVEAETQEEAVAQVDALPPYEIKKRGDLVDETPDGAVAQ